MRMLITVVDGDHHRDLLLTAADTATVAELAGALGATELHLGRRRLDPAQPLGAAGVRTGAILGLAGPVPDPPDPAVATHLRVVGGPDAGAVFPVGDGETVLGRSSGAGVRLSDVDVSRRHAAVMLADASAAVRDLGSSNGTTVDGLPVPADAEVPLPVGAMLGVGQDLLVLAPPTPADAALTPTADGAVEFSRPPRLLPAPRRVVVDLPAEPGRPERRALPVLSVLLPLALGGVMYAVTRSAYMFLFLLMSPVLLIGSYVTEHRSGRRSYRRQRAEFEQRRERAESTIRDSCAAETAARREAAPDPATLALTATGPRRRLWERRRSDDDCLVVRLGLATLPAQVEVSAPLGSEQPEPPRLADVPVTVSLREVGVLGLAGAGETVRACARWLVAQTAVLTSPRDVSVVLLSAAEAGGAGWAWLRWLPHATDTDGTVLVGTDADTIAARIEQLGGLVEARRLAAADVRGRLSVASLPAVVVVLDGARTLRALPGVAEILQDGPAVGVHAICVDTEDRYLPEECQAVAVLDADVPARLVVRRTGAADVVDVRPDGVTPEWGDRVARALAPIRDVSRDSADDGLPATVRLLDLLQLDPPRPEAVAARWRTAGRSTTVVLGLTGDGPLLLDLTTDGPHGLIAGTTGAGKSELLQTLVASLAVANRPEALTFVLVDYKGGSAFKDCARLPHTVGMVTDLDAHLTERALTSLSAELRRRERRLAEAGAKDIEDYWATGAAEAQPLPRLVIVIDEFASLVEELPDFVRGLVGIAQRGRSLGVHLVLATQRPSGVVSPEIRANTNLRIALRVTDTAESADVIDAPDAARISRTTPGRGFARTGHASLVPFQAARVGGRRPGATGAEALTVVELPWERAGWPRPRGGSVAVDDDDTDLHLLVEAVRAAAADLGVAEPAPPWLPPLPAAVTVEAVAGVTTSGADAVVFGAEDRPDQQSRGPVQLDLAHGSHLLVAGASRTGRSTVLRTIAGVVARDHRVDDVHVYAIDCGNGALLPLAELPHCGAVVTRQQTERADRLLTRLGAEVARRLAALANAGYADVAEQRRAAAAGDARAGEPLPYLLLLVDRWEGFLGSLDPIDDGRLTDQLFQLLREGPAAGLRAVVTGDRSALLGKLPGLVEDKIVLRLADRTDVTLANLNPRTLPDTIPAGRGFRADTGVELQVALLDPDPSGPAQVAALHSLAATARDVAATDPPRTTPMRVDVLPTAITYTDATALLPARPRSPLWTLVGVGGDELTSLGVDLETVGPGFTIAGPARSGRSTALLAVVRSLLDVGTRVAVFAPRPSPLRELAGQPGVVGVVTTAEPTEDDVERLLDGVVTPLAVVVDDAELLHPADAQPALVDLFRTARDLTRAVVVAGTTEELIGAFRGFTVEARKSRSGLLLSPASYQHGELLGIRLPRSAAFTGPPGRGLLVAAGSATLVQVPQPAP